MAENLSYLVMCSPLQKTFVHSSTHIRHRITKAHPGLLADPHNIIKVSQKTAVKNETFVHISLLS